MSLGLQVCSFPYLIKGEKALCGTECTHISGNGFTHSSCRACGAQSLPSCCSPASSGWAPGPCTSAGWARGRPPAAIAARWALVGETKTEKSASFTSWVLKQSSRLADITILSCVIYLWCKRSWSPARNVQPRRARSSRCTSLRRTEEEAVHSRSHFQIL